MEENLILDKLVQFGLTRQEANIYLCLYQNGELTGYEVAKMTGISRSNVYGGLSDLTDKGAAFWCKEVRTAMWQLPLRNSVIIR